MASDDLQMSSTSEVGFVWAERDKGRGTPLDHVAIVPGDWHMAMSFYVEGIGLSPLAEGTFNGPFVRLFDAPSDRLRAVLLGDPTRRVVGRLELLQFLDDDGLAINPEAPPVGGYATGFFLLSFLLDIDHVSSALVRAGWGATLQVVDRGGRRLGSVRDPDGNLVELIEASLTASGGET
jgi:catechol 2,3-dioxygenase-like lactoylglutathione lyase family enzyme